MREFGGVVVKKTAVVANSNPACEIRVCHPAVFEHGTYNNSYACNSCYYTFSILRPLVWVCTRVGGFPGRFERLVSNGHPTKNRKAKAYEWIVGRIPLWLRTVRHSGLEAGKTH